MERVSLKVKFAVLIAALIAASMAVNLFWTSQNARAQMEDQLREKGEVLSQQMNCVWEFMVSNQERFEQISYTDEGIYQGLHCAIVGRSIGALFTSQTDYTTRFVNFNPRNSADEPDEFEAEALQGFIDGKGGERYQIVEQDGREVFRYMTPMRIDKNCLECHGQPKGEIDVTGFPKEGWSLGDVGGAISITMPLDVYAQAEQQSIQQDVLFFGIMLVLCLLVIFGALGSLVTRPLRKIQDGVSAMQSGDLAVQVEPIQSSREINALVRDFNSMASELSKSYSTLESQVADRTAALAKANEELKVKQTELEAANAFLSDENRFKSEFLAMMSHELRTPLTSIIAFTELLRRDRGELDPEEEQVVSEIETNSRVLLMMINDILEMSRLDAGRMGTSMEVVDMADVVGMVESVIRPLAQKKGVSFAVDAAPDIPLTQADFEKLRHVLENLCNNAVKFTDPGGSVSMDADCVTDADGRKSIRVRVSDTGIGIDPADHERVFQKFFQVDSSLSRRHGGTGLGLALAKEYVELHGGTIELESRAGEGSVFTVTIPVQDI